jgi:hypothetical protein
MSPHPGYLGESATVIGAHSAYARLSQDFGAHKVGGAISCRYKRFDSNYWLPLHSIVAVARLQALAVRRSFLRAAADGVLLGALH